MKNCKIIFVFKTESGEIKRLERPLPLFVCQNEYYVPEGTKLHEVILQGAKRVDSVLISGQETPKSKTIAVKVVRGGFFRSQRFELRPPLADTVQLTFNMENGSVRGADITNAPVARRYLKAGKKVCYTEFAISLDQEDHIFETVS